MNEIQIMGNGKGDGLRKVRRKRQKLLIMELFSEYAENSTLHGLRYIPKKGLSIIEKVFWIITFVVSIVLCSYLIKNVYVKWQNSPVIVTVNERFVSAGEVPFPSVTICPQIKSKATVYNMTERINYFYMSNPINASQEEQEMFADISIICDAIIGFFYGTRNHTNSSMIDHIDYVAPSLSDVFQACSWRTDAQICSVIFKKVYTSDGLCFHMNGISAEEMFRDTLQTDYKYSENVQPTKGWSLSHGYVEGYTKYEYFPKRGSENGHLPDLSVILRSNDRDNDGSCNNLISGYKVYFQHPTDFPQSSMYYYAAINEQISSLAISFNLIETSETLESYSADERQCYFPKDRQLRYFKIYTLKNCRAECLSNYTFALCGCVGFFMPHNSSSQICVDKKIICMRYAHDYMAEKELSLELAKSVYGCRCLPACNTVEYEAEVLSSEFNLGKVLKGHYSGLDSMKYSRIDMYFKKPRFVSMRRSELFGLTDFLANIGGLLGVFLGFSFLSLIEILYFITFRVGCSLKRDSKEERKRDEAKAF